MKKLLMTTLKVWPLLLVFSAAVAETEASDPLIDQGRDVFTNIAGIGCKTCHGDYGEGDLGVGPYIRGASRGSIQAAINGIGEMGIIKNVITDEEITAVTAYLQHLGTLTVVRTLSKRGRFLPADAEVAGGTPVQLIIKNASVQPANYVSDHLLGGGLTIAGRSTSSVEWVAPDAEGEYSLSCTDCKLKNQKFSLRVQLQP